MRRAIVALAVCAAVLAAAAAAAGPTRLTVLLDWTPNPDHVGIYDAEQRGLFARAGLSVSVKAPSDPTSPLKLVAAGRVDLAVSYEQEVFFARARGLPVVAVAAVVPHPLNSLMWINPAIRSPADLRGRKIGITGVPSDYALVDTILAGAHLERSDVKLVSVGYNLLPALLAGRVDAVIGVYRNVEGVELALRGKKPHVLPVDAAGVPSYDELVLVANAQRLHRDGAYAGAVRRFVGALERGSRDARAHPGAAISLLAHVTQSSRAFLAAATPITLRLLAGRHGTTCLDTRAWQRFGAWMHARRLLARAVPARTAMTTAYLPSACRGG